MKKNILVISVLLLSKSAFAEFKQNWTLFECMNNFKYCTQAQTGELKEKDQIKSLGDCQDFGKNCEKYFDNVCDAIKTANPNYNCNTDKKLETEYKEKFIEKIKDKKTEDEELIKEFKEAFQPKKTIETKEEKIENKKEIPAKTTRIISVF